MSSNKYLLFFLASTFFFACGESDVDKPIYQYHFETGAYVEAGRNEIFLICPSKEVDGTWICEYTVALNPDNCLSVQAPNLAGTFRILFMENSGRTDTIQVLVEQSYIQMGDYSHRVWTTDKKYDMRFGSAWRCSGDECWEITRQEIERDGRYENRSYSQPLIVDKTKLTMGDALYYHKMDTSIITHWTFESDEYKNKKLEGSNLPLIDVNQYNSWRLANKRSKKEGLDTVYYINDSGLAIDTSASGYRLPFKEEWLLLMRAGASTRYYWGEDSSKVSRYEWVSPIGLKPVAQRLPNGFGLYDMAGIADEWVHSGSWGFVLSCGDLSPDCTIINKIRPRENYKGLRLLRKTPKLYKLEKF
ncbi:MAG: formylglycine-generating enzyme family protein [Candidatus Fibromonas sp.]|jgi:hypothetical protein|nr:formylglycine-generating enzyme family protein [Candidatus Fibromonas sp.]